MSLWLADAEPSYDTLEAEPDYVDWSQPGRRTTGKSEQRERGSTASSRSPDRRATQSAGKTFNIDQDSNGSFLWRKPDQSFTCSIGTAKKNTKFGGMRSYITYPLTASHTNIQVRLASSAVASKATPCRRSPASTTTSSGFRPGSRRNSGR